EKGGVAASSFRYCCGWWLLLVAMAGGAIGLELLPLRVLIRRQHGRDLGLFGGADLLHLRALRIDGRLQRVHLGGVIRLLGREELLHRAVGLLEERRVLLPRLLLDGLDLVLLRVGEVELLRQL